MTTINNNFNVNTLIDTIQNAKREWVNTVLTDETQSKAAVAVLEAETSFAKSLTETTQKYFDAITDVVSGK